MPLGTSAAGYRILVTVVNSCALVAFRSAVVTAISKGVPIFGAASSHTLETRTRSQLLKARQQHHTLGPRVTLLSTTITLAPLAMTASPITTHSMVWACIPFVVSTTSNITSIIWAPPMMVRIKEACPGQSTCGAENQSRRGSGF